MTQAEANLRNELNEQLRFEALVARLSARFINLPPDQVDSIIEDSQRLLCENLGLDRSSLFQCPNEGPSALLLTHFYQRTAGPRREKRADPISNLNIYWTVRGTETQPIHERLDAKDTFPWFYQQLQLGETIVVPAIEDLPPEAARDREMLIRYETKSTVVIPLSTGKTLLGCLSFAAVDEPRIWPEALVKRLQFIADVFANALARQRADRKLAESEARLSLAAEGAGAGLWSMEPDIDRIWATTKTRELFCVGPDENLTYKSLFRTIHPDDREPVRRAVQQALHEGTELRVDYRVSNSRGSIRWISSLGRPFRGSASGSPRLMGVSVDITGRKRGEEALRAAFDEIHTLKEKLETENVCLREEIDSISGRGEIVGQSEALVQVIEQARQVAKTDSTVLILGETGTGKEQLARFIHAESARGERLLITANLAAMPPTLIENELFGREKGAYTGAMARQIGRFEAAHEGTIFLDEIGEMPPETQVKILRVLQDGRFERLGSTTTIQVNVRIIAATNRNLAEAVKKGTFRQDLYYRLNVFPITLPPLRDRREDIPLLVWAFVKEFGEKMGKFIDRIHRGDLDKLKTYLWPGNIRELRNVVERAMILARGPELRISLPESAKTEVPPGLAMTDMEKQHILRVLETTNGRIGGKGGAADILGLKSPTLYFRMKRLGIQRKP